VRAEAAPIDRTLILKDEIWTARLRTDHVAIFQASDSRAFSAAALIASVAAVDSAVIASAVAVDLEAVALGDSAGSAVEDLAVFAAAADSGADDEN
jgi:hypothetical protein